jgi:DNA polymerase-1
VVLVDGTALIYRAFFAIPNSLSTSSGVPTNATFGFATMFRKIFAGKRPVFGAVIFDAPGPTFRDEAYPDYKAQRPRMKSELRQQLPDIDRIVDAHGFPRLRISGYEADDIIGTLARRAEAAGHEVVIVSGDKDFAQLISDKIRMVDPMRDITYDPELVRKKWGVPPEQFVDYLALLGDKIDNVPGVPGIGAKTAASLLAEFGDLETVLASTHTQKGKRRENLETYADQARLSQQLVTIDTNAVFDATLEDLRLTDPDEDVRVALLKELEFYSLLPEDAVPDGAEAGAVADRASLTALLAAERVAVVPLWSGDTPMVGGLAGVAVATPETALYVPLAEVDVVDVLRPWLADAARPKVLHGARAGATVLARHGLPIAGIDFDTRLASFLADPAGHLPHDLGRVVRAYLQRTVATAKQVQGGGKSARALVDVEVEAAAGLACQWATAVAELDPILRDQLDALDQRSFLDDVGLPLSAVLSRMQRRGIRVDAAHLETLQREFAARKAEVEAHIYALAGRTFNIGSTKQLGAVLFDELGLPVLKRTKTGYSTAADVLQRLAPKHEIAESILDQRALAKLINTYTRVLREAVLPETGRVHCSIQQTVGVSGRLIATDPDLQRTPIRTQDGRRIREAFVPADGLVLISADWSQIELRLLAHFTGDARLRDAFANQLDVHARTAAELFGVAPEDVDRQQRNVGKTVNFATIYGQGATALGASVGVSRKEAKGFLDRYFDVYSGVRTWLDATIAEAYERGYVETLLGRRRIIRELTSNNPTDRAYGERIAANTPIQGSAADLCKLAMLAIDQRLEADFEARMLLQIHDELLFEAPPGEVDAVIAMVREQMENVWPALTVPLVVDVGHGESWEAAH